MHTHIYAGNIIYAHTFHVFLDELLIVAPREHSLLFWPNKARITKPIKALHHILETTLLSFELKFPGKFFSEIRENKNATRPNGEERRCLKQIFVLHRI